MDHGGYNQNTLYEFSKNDLKKKQTLNAGCLLGIGNTCALYKVVKVYIGIF